MSEPGAKGRVIAARDGIAVGEFENVCIVVWRDSVTAPRFEAQRQGLLEVIRRNPRGAGFLCVIEPTSKPPGDELRRASAKLIEDNQSALRGIACVVEGTGFGSALARSALSAMMLLVGPRRVPLTVVGDVRAGASWLATRADTKDTVSLVKAVHALRTELAPWDPSLP